MQYWMLRLFLTSRERPPIIEATATRKTSRRDYLQATFTTDIRFQYRARNYVYKYFSQDGDVIAAVVGRVHTATIGGPPEKDFQPEEVPDWGTANVFIDVSGDTEGQKVAMQRAPQMSNPIEIMRALTDHINARDPDTDWVIAVNAISDKKEFWDAVEAHKGEITELDLVFIPPNIWGAKDETEKALKALHQSTNTDEVEVQLKNADGKLVPEGEVMEQSIQYVTKGGGRAILRKGRKKLYDSESKVSVETPEDDAKVQTADEGRLKALVSRLFGR
jgi:hypothetical protein